jgi:SAM-dependent methyltransferase
VLRKIAVAAARSLWSAGCVGCETGDILGRYVMYKKLGEQFAGHDLGDRVLSISHSRKLCSLLGAQESAILDANYPEHSLADLRFAANSFSAVVSDQVLEHIACPPEQAVAEVFRVLRPGGFAVHTTAFMMGYHGAADFSDLDNGDFWRFSPSGLMRLHARYAEVIAADGWGNVLIPLLGGLGLLWAPVPEASWHPFNKLARLNRPSYAWVVWIIARK